MSDTAAQPQPQPQPERLLLLGEADFSFALALARCRAAAGPAAQAPSLPAMLATEYGSPEDVAARYYGGDLGRVAARAAEHTAAGVAVAFSVDSTALAAADPTCVRFAASATAEQPVTETVPLWSLPAAAAGPFSAVVFNYPNSTKRGRQQRLLLQTFRALRQCVAAGRCTPAVEMEMRLMDMSQHSHFNRRGDYGHEEAAAAAGFALVSAALCSEETALAAAGYRHRQTSRDASGGGGALEGSRAWRWRAGAVAPAAPATACVSGPGVEATAAEEAPPLRKTRLESVEQS
jgi:hypothetical protein